MQSFINNLIPNFSREIIYDGLHYYKTPRDIIKKHLLDFLNVLNRSKSRITLVLIDDNSFGGFIKYWLITLMRFYKSKCYIINSNEIIKFPFLINIKVDEKKFKVERYFEAAVFFLRMNDINDNTKYTDYFSNDLINIKKEKY